MINSGVFGRGALSGTDPPKSGRRVTGVPAQEKTRQTKKPQTPVLEKGPKKLCFILSLSVRKKRGLPKIFVTIEHLPKIGVVLGKPLFSLKKRLKGSRIFKNSLFFEAPSI
jgi:hypothetical protein